ncbi:dnaJ protein P58IPK-like protein [Senna tora]|uniref:DnaJ protein P58IPK-like protein n=1 Tax=Senna tora TaxID=362788 RepID=A0A835CBA4_9FABA|nr:dnaJ protein P58IPK-like protein [Senna tora]
MHQILRNFVTSNVELLYSSWQRFLSILMSFKREIVLLSVPLGNREEEEAKFKEIVVAYEVLSDENKRTRYDRGEDLEDMGMGRGGGGFNPFDDWGQQFT